MASGMALLSLHMGNSMKVPQAITVATTEYRFAYFPTSVTVDLLPMSCCDRSLLLLAVPAARSCLHFDL